MSRAKPFYFGLSYQAQAGCYMPDSYLTAERATTRREIVESMRAALNAYDLPQSLMSQVKWNKVFAHAKRHGTSGLHFSMTHRRGTVNFHGLTEDEYNDWRKAEGLDD